MLDQRWEISNATSEITVCSTCNFQKQTFNTAESTLSWHHASIGNSWHVFGRAPILSLSSLISLLLTTALRRYGTPQFVISEVESSLIMKQYWFCRLLHIYPTSKKEMELALDTTLVGQLSAFDAGYFWSDAWLSRLEFNDFIFCHSYGKVNWYNYEKI